MQEAGRTDESGPPGFHRTFICGRSTEIYGPIEPLVACSSCKNVLPKTHMHTNEKKTNPKNLQAVLADSRAYLAFAAKEKEIGGKVSKI